MKSLTDRVRSTPPHERGPLEDPAQVLGTSKGRIVRVALHRIYDADPGPSSRAGVEGEWI
jgi:hypothetical protein